MSIQILSDVHTEFQRDGGVEFFASLDEVKADVVVLAGDLSNAAGLENAVALACKRFSKVVYVPGNHEYYGASPSHVQATLARCAQRHDNFHWLDCTVLEWRDVRFVGATLWFEDTTESQRFRSGMSDFAEISGFVPWVFEENRRARAFFEATVRSGDIVVTHHLPSPQSTHAKYKGSPMTPFFECNMEHVIKKNEPALWIHGHTHERVDYPLGATRVIANPLGYVGYESQAQFDPKLIVQL